jgi:hypothetical protein
MTECKEPEIAGWPGRSGHGEQHLIHGVAKRVGRGRGGEIGG